MAYKKKKKIWLIPAVTGVVIAAAGGFLVYRGITEKKAAQTESTAVQTAQTDTGNTVSGSVTWKGKQYVYNDHLSNFLFLGVDTREKTATAQGQADAGQTDALFLVSWDRAAHNIALITIPRDTMTDIETFDVEGNSLGMSKDHISLAYAFGDGAGKSCELTEEAVSNLLYGIPIQGYCSINMDAIPVLADAIGGVTVTVPDDSLEAVDPQFQKGAEVLITSDNAETFVRYRDTEQSQSAISRMNRQNAFLDAYAAKAKEEFSKNPGFITDLYTDLEPYMVTNIGNDQFAKVLQDASEETMRARWTVPGEGTEGESFDEYHVDDGQLYEKIMETFYEEAE